MLALAVPVFACSTVFPKFLYVDTDNGVSCISFDPPTESDLGFVQTRLAEIFRIDGTTVLRATREGGWEPVPPAEIVVDEDEGHEFHAPPSDR